jgi:hypothetical protein
MRLDEAAVVYDAERSGTKEHPNRDAGPPKLHAAKRVVLALVDFLLAVDRGELNAALRRRHAALDLTKALDDLQQGREPPDWIRGHKLAYRGREATVLWEARALAAGVLQRIIDAGVSKAEATQAVWKVAGDRGLEAKKPETVYGWLRQCREIRDGSNLPQRAKTYRNFLDHFPVIPGIRPEAAMVLLLHTLENELERGGFPLRKSGR